MPHMKPVKIHLFQKILIIMFGYQESFQKNSYLLGYQSQLIFFEIVELG